MVVFCWLMVVFLLLRLCSEKVKLFIGIGKFSFVFCFIGWVNNWLVGLVLNFILVISFGILMYLGVRFVCSMLLEFVIIFSVMFCR